MASGHNYYPSQVHERRAGVLELMGQWDQAECIRRMNLEAARAGGAPGGIVQSILKMTSLLQRLGRYLEAGSLLDEAQGLMASDPDPKTAGQVLAGRGVLHYRQGDHQKAMELYGQALQHYLRCGFGEGTSNMYNNMGVILEGRGEYQRAMDCYRAKRAIDEAAGNRRGIGTVLNNLGVCLLHQGELERAREMFQEKLALEQSIGNKTGVATALTNLGIVFRNLREYGRALECCRRTIEICRELGDHRGEGITTNNMGNIHKEMNQPERALECYRSALAVAEAQGDRKDIAIYSGNIGQIHHHFERDPDRAMEHYGRAIAILREMDQPYHLCDHLLYRAQLLLETGRKEEAEEGGRQALAAAERANRSDTAFQARVLLARLAAGADPDGATGRLRELAGQAPDEALRAEALCWLAMASGRDEDRSEALRALNDAGGGRESHEINDWMSRLKRAGGGR